MSRHVQQRLDDWGFRTLVVDPGWRFEDKLGRRGAEHHYEVNPLTGRSTMSLEEILRFPLPPLHHDCRLFLWRVASMQEEALLVIKEWGFTLKSELIWVKTTQPFEETPEGRFPQRSRDGKPPRVAFGMGRTVRGSHETCLIAVRGRPELLNRRTRSVFFAPLGEHSEKPDKFYETVEQMSPGPLCELFARKERPGWTTYGLEVGTPHPGADVREG